MVPERQMGGTFPSSVPKPLFQAGLWLPLSFPGDLEVGALELCWWES